MHITIVQFLADLADSIVVRNRQNERLSGLLKIYGCERKYTPRRPHCIHLDRIVGHLRNECIRIQAEQNIDLSFTELDVRRAIASFMPAKGIGSKAHVTIRTDSRKEWDSLRSEAQREADRKEQDLFFAEFVTAEVALPSLNIAVDGVITTV